MAQTTLIPEDHTTVEQQFEGIGPYSQKMFRLAPAPSASLLDVHVAAPPPRETMPRPSRVFQDIEALERRVSISSRWYDIGVSLLILISSGAALYRLIWMGQP